VTTAQSAALADEVAAVNILGRRMTSAVLLIKRSAAAGSLALPERLNAAADLPATQGNAAMLFAKVASHLRAASPSGALYADFEVGSPILTPLPVYGLAAGKSAVFEKMRNRLKSLK